MANGAGTKKTSVAIDADVTKVKKQIGEVVGVLGGANEAGKELDRFIRTAEQFSSKISIFKQLADFLIESERAVVGFGKAQREALERAKKENIERLISFESLREFKLALQEINNILGGIPGKIAELKKEKASLEKSIVFTGTEGAIFFGPQLDEVNNALASLREFRTAIEEINIQLQREQVRFIDQGKVEERFAALEKRVGKFNQLFAKISELDSKVNKLDEKLSNFIQIDRQRMEDPQPVEKAVGLSPELEEVITRFEVMNKSSFELLLEEFKKGHPSLKNALQSGEDLDAVKDKAEEAEEAIGQAEAGMKQFVATSGESFENFQSLVRRVMGNVEGLFGRSTSRMADRWFGFIRQLVSGAQAGGRGILEGLFGGLFGILGPGRGSARSSGGIGFPDIFGGISGMGTPPFILNFAGSGTVSSVGTVSQSGAGGIPKALGGATQGLLEEYRLAA